MGNIFPALNTLATAGRGQAVRPAGEQERLRAVCRAFEAVLLEMLLHEARGAAAAGSEGDQPSFARGVFEGWQDGQLAGSMSAAGGIGLADLLLRQLVPPDKQP